MYLVDFMLFLNLIVSKSSIKYSYLFWKLICPKRGRRQAAAALDYFLSSISFGCLSAKMSTAMYPSWVSCRAERWSCLLVFGRQVRELLCSCSYVNLSTDWRPGKYKDRPHRLHYLTQYIALYFMVMVSCAFLEWLHWTVG